MFGFLRNRTIGETGILHGMTDWHCHILPRVDDGFRSLEDSLEALSRYESLGVSEVWLTPHVMEDVPSTTEALKNRFSELCDAYKGPLRLYLAAEYMMDSLSGTCCLLEPEESICWWRHPISILLQVLWRYLRALRLPVTSPCWLIRRGICTWTWRTIRP